MKQHETVLSILFLMFIFESVSPIPRGKWVMPQHVQRTTTGRKYLSVGFEPVMRDLSTPPGHLDMDDEKLTPYLTNFALLQDTGQQDEGYLGEKEQMDMELAQFDFPKSPRLQHKHVLLSGYYGSPFYMPMMGSSYAKPQMFVAASAVPVMATQEVVQVRPILVHQPMQHAFIQPQQVQMFHSQPMMQPMMQQVIQQPAAVQPQIVQQPAAVQPQIVQQPAAVQPQLVQQPAGQTPVQPEAAAPQTPPEEQPPASAQLPQQSRFQLPTGEASLQPQPQQPAPVQQQPVQQAQAATPVAQVAPVIVKHHIAPQHILIVLPEPTKKTKKRKYGSSYK